MKTLEEPPYLTVGTDVSAKYRGAFCEAKIKTAKRLVKAKVTFKPDLTTVEVHDDSIKGPLKVGAVVEVKNPDGVYQEACINKLTDCSIYTVVFDDGDEKTLRRSSLCLKGARHFAESETLDRLPLTNPEHFGTPVIGKKGNRGRRSNPVQEEESSSSSSEEEDGDGTQNEELFGKVVCVEGGSASASDKKTKGSTWYPALVITSDCHEEATMKKDTVFVRSFKDGKFNTVLRKEVRLMDMDLPPKADPGLRPALDAALQFVRQAVVPSSWRTEVKAESSSSEDDDDEEEEEHEEDPSEEEEEEEVEPFPEERENFLQQLYKFMEDRGTPINKKPVLGYRSLDLFKLYRLVHKLGGFHDIESGTVWKTVYQALGIPVLNSAAGYNVKCAYRKYLYGFEEYCTSCAISFRMDLPLKQPKPEGRQTEGGGEKPGSGGSTIVPPDDSEEEQKQKAPSEIETPSAEETIKSNSAQLILFKPEETEPLKAEQRKTEQKDEDEEDDDHQKHGSDDEEGPSFARLRAEGVKLEPFDEEQEGKEEDISGYDEWVKADKIVRPANKNVQKIKHRKKIKNKSDRERDRLTRLNEDLGSPSPNNLRIPRPSSKSSGPGPAHDRHVFSQLDDASETSTDDSDHEDEEGERDDEDDRPGGRSSLRKGGPPEPPDASDQQEGSSPAEVTGKSQEPISVETQDAGKRRCQPEFLPEREGPEREGPAPSSAASRKRKSEGAAVDQRSPKGPLSKTKPPTRSTRSADWLPGGSPRRTEERGRGGAVGGSPRRTEERGRGGGATGGSCSSSDDDDEVPNDPQQEQSDRERPSTRPKPKPSPSKKYNGMKDKAVKGGSAGVGGARPAAFWEIPEKRAKMTANNTEERERSAGGGRTKGQKDVWSSIQAQWPKKTLKELFSDSDTEAANSPPPAPAVSSSSGLEERESSGEREEEEVAGGEERKDPDSSEEQLEEKGRNVLEEEEEEKRRCELEEVKRRSEQEEFPSSGSNSVLNTPPTTPESPSGAMEQGSGSNGNQPSSPPPAVVPSLGTNSSPDPLTLGPPGRLNPLAEGPPGRLNSLAEGPAGRLNPLAEGPAGRLNPLAEGPPGRLNPLAEGPPGRLNPVAEGPPGQPNPLAEEGGGVRSETDSSTLEVESLGGELQDQDTTPDQEQSELPPHGVEGSPSSQTKAFLADGLGSLSSSHSQSNSTCSLELSSSSQHENTEHKAKVSASQKRPKESQAGGVVKKHKPNRKSSVPPKKNRKTAHSSDSEDQFVGESRAKSPASKTNTATDLKGAISPKCQGPGRTPPSSQKYHKQQSHHADPDHNPQHHRDHHRDHHHPHHREHHVRTPRVYKWSFQMSDLEKMSSLDRIAFLQDKLQDIRNHYLSLKSEVASIDRRRKRIKKKERESTVAASSSSSSSSSPSSSSLTAAVMLTLADPPVSSSSSQNSGVSVECR
ncbi:AT-rich interactive domain-containing protein 4B isoform X2 [Esox lucius]|uniref:ARID domain-containing protein n=1 Tax=Esox lucius TaxID=8010 RepID=A0A3P9ACH4_ESOLU|nr:AT-rich interactive domain-containing protein 4B isoform X2 [Esox lucius]